MGTTVDFPVAERGNVLETRQIAYSGAGPTLLSAPKVKAYLGETNAWLAPIVDTKPLPQTDPVRLIRKFATLTSLQSGCRREAARDPLKYSITDVMLVATMF